MTPTDPDPQPSPLSRRTFLKGAGGVAAVNALAGSEARAAGQPAATERGGGQEAGQVPTLRGAVEVTLRINGEARALVVEPRTTLLDALRTRLEPALTGAKLVCDSASCGACTVLLDGRPAYACTNLAIDCVDRAITTVEGLGSPDAPSDVQAAFCAEDAAMCGFCTPGFVVACHAALDKRPDGTLDELKHEISGNLCRCGTYPHIFNALQRVQRERQAQGRKKEAR